MKDIEVILSCRRLCKSMQTLIYIQQLALRLPIYVLSTFVDVLQELCDEDDQSPEKTMMSDVTLKDPPNSQKPLRAGPLPPVMKVC